MKCENALGMHKKSKGKCRKHSKDEDLKQIYTRDHHFLNEEFQRLEAEMINPLEDWITT